MHQITESLFTTTVTASQRSRISLSFTIITPENINSRCETKNAGRDRRWSAVHHHNRNTNSGRERYKFFRRSAAMTHSVPSDAKQIPTNVCHASTGKDSILRAVKRTCIGIRVGHGTQNGVCGYSKFRLGNRCFVH